MRSERCGKWRYSVPMPTPASAAISRTGASTPDVANTVSAASSNASIFRCASARTGRDVGAARPASSLSAAGSFCMFKPYANTHLTNGTLFRIISSSNSERCSILHHGYVFDNGHLHVGRADAKSLRQSLTHQFCLVFGGEAAKDQTKDT